MVKIVKGRGLRFRGAFTLIELMVVIAVIGLLAMLAVPNFMRYLRQAQRTKCCSNLLDIRDATYAYLADHANEPLPEFSADFITDTLPRLGYLRTVPECPLGGKYAYASTIKTELDYAKGSGAVGVVCDKSSFGHTMPGDAGKQ